jgi:hypothetical protein
MMTHSSTTIQPGRVVALTACPAYRDAIGCRVSGLYALVEHESPDPSVGILSSCWLAVPAATPADADTDGIEVTIDDYDLWEQVDPRGYSRFLVDERWMEFAAHDAVQS